VCLRKEACWFLLEEFYKPTVRFGIRVSNKGTDGILYKLISNQVEDNVSLNVLFVKEDVDYELYSKGVNLLRDGSRLLYGATDGYYRFRHAHLFTTDDPDHWRDRCDDQVDVYLFDNAGRADALEGCRIRLHLRDSDPELADLLNMPEFTADNGKVFVHEYGHFGFGIADEYCEEDVSDDSAVRECPFNLSGTTGIRTQGLCPTSLMANHDLGEFCTSLSHRSFGITNQVNPSWAEIPLWRPNPSFLECLSATDFSACMNLDVGPREPEATPNPHQYTEDMFVPFFEVCFADGSCSTP